MVVRCTPCVSAPLVGALAYVGETGSAMVGGLALFMLGLGMGFPLLIIGASAGKLLPKSGHWMESIKKFFGVMLIAMAVWLWSRILPASIILALSGILAINCAIYLGAFEAAAKGWPRFAKATGFVCGVYGVSLLLGAVSGSENIFEPLDRLAVWHKQNSKDANPAIHAEFVRVKNITQLQQAIRVHLPQVTLVDFSADWCVACQEMQHNVFDNATVQKYFQENNIQLLQVDVTVADPEIQAILDSYQVVAPPTLLLFDRKGHWLSDATIVGLQSPDVFLQLLQKNIKL